jgi:hypothetical protein
MQSRYKRILTIKFVLEKVGADKFALSYLPNDPETHVSQTFLYTILNTLDSNFFVRIIDEIEAQHQSKLQQKPEKVIRIDPSMM